MHQGLSCTTASMITQLDPDPGTPRVAWASFGRPCSSAFFPVLLGATLPDALARGSEGPSDALWWVFERLSLLAERNEAVRAHVRTKLDDLERHLEAALASHLRELSGAGAGDLDATAPRFMAGVAARLDGQARALLVEAEAAAR